MPGYPIVGMDGTENPRKVVRLHPLALQIWRRSLIGKAADLKSAAVKRLWVRVLPPPLMVPQLNWIRARCYERRGWEFNPLRNYETFMPQQRNWQRSGLLIRGLKVQVLPKALTSPRWCNWLAQQIVILLVRIRVPAMGYLSFAQLVMAPALQAGKTLVRIQEGRLNIARSPSGKAEDSDSFIRWFKSITGNYKPSCRSGNGEVCKTIHEWVQFLQTALLQLYVVIGNRRDSKSRVLCSNRSRAANICFIGVMANMTAFQAVVVGSSPA